VRSVAHLRRWFRKLLLRWELAYGGILLAIEGMKEMDEACKSQQA
jgi:hypothetical protein